MGAANWLASQWSPSPGEVMRETLVEGETLVVDVSDLPRGATRALEHADHSILLCNVDGEFYAGSFDPSV